MNGEKGMRLLFLEGERGIGKSAMILEAAAPHREKGSGLFSQRLVDEAGRTRAFRLCAYQSVTGSTAPYMGQPHIFLHTDNGRGGIHPEVFDQARNIIGAYRDARFLVLDEIGGVELSSARFRVFLYELLNSGIPCIGVVKSRNNWEDMKQRVPALSHTAVWYEKLRAGLAAPGGQTVVLTDKNRREVQSMVKDFFKEVTVEGTK